jgi:N-acetylglucosaminyldiphosphoundecaprenol N-acetyl-beta-D-mannosaminyltransferase
LDSVTLLGVRIDKFSASQLIDFILRMAQADQKVRAAYVNIHAINLAQELSWMRDFFNHSAAVYCDGFGVKWGAGLLGLTIPERLSPPDWIHALAAQCSRRQYSFYFLGSKPGTAERVGAILKQQSPGLVMAGFQHGFFDKTPESRENKAVLQSISKAKPDVLLVGMGMPTQERWILENWDHIEAKVILPVGALFDYLAGEFSRAPGWMTDHGLEWVGRLFIEPRRLWRRYLLGNPRFLWLLAKEKLRQVRAR